MGRVKLTEARRKILARAAINVDGARIRGAGKYRCCRAMVKDGLGDFLVVGEGRMSRFLISDTGRALLASNAGDN
jgi:hypothetical protein